MWSREAEAVSLALGSTARGRSPLQALCTSLRRTSTVKYSAMASRMNWISSSVGCGRAVISELLSVRMPPATRDQQSNGVMPSFPANQVRCGGELRHTATFKARHTVCNDTLPMPSEHLCVQYHHNYAKVCPCCMHLTVLIFLCQDAIELCMAPGAS